MRITATRPLVVYENPNTSETINARLDSHFRQFKAYPPVKVHKPEENNIELLLVVTPSATSEIYAPVKRYCDSIAGVASQCIARANLDKPHDKLRQLALNLLMKINSKLGGVNVSLRELPPSLRSGTVRVLSLFSDCRYSSVRMSVILLPVPHRQEQAWPR